MNRLGIPKTADLVRGVHLYLDETIGDFLAPDFYDNQDLDDYPISGDWLRSLWSDPTLPFKARSTYALTAARLYAGRWVNGVQVRKPSISAPAETGPCFVGVFHTLNQRRAQSYH